MIAPRETHPRPAREAEGVSPEAAEDAAQGDPGSDASIAPPPQRMRRSQLVVGAILGAVLTFLAGVVLLVALNRDSIPIVTADRLETARQLWKNANLKSYTMKIELHGAQPGQVEIHVVNGAPESLVRDGYVPERRTWDIWTVAGMFEMIEDDLRNRDDPEKAFHVSDPGSVAMFCEFDANRGFPKRYRRSVAGQDYDIEWNVVEFTPE